MISALTPVCDKLVELEITTALKLCSRLLARVQPSMAGQGSSLDRSFSVDTLGDNVSVFSNSEWVTAVEQPTIKETDESKCDTKEDSSDNKSGSDVASKGEEEAAGVSNSRTKLSSFEADVSEANGNGTKGKEEAGVSTVYENGTASKVEQDKSTADQAPSTFTAVTNAFTTTTTSSTQKAAFGHLSLMQLCVQSFQQFFHSFTQLHILQTPDFAQACMTGLMGCGKPCLKVPPAFSSSVQGGKSSQKDSLSTENKNSQGGSVNRDGTKKADESLCTVDPAEVQRAYKQACKLLVDFASFPIYCLDYETIIEQMCSKGEIPYTRLFCNLFCFVFQSKFVSQCFDCLFICFLLKLSISLYFSNVLLLLVKIAKSCFLTVLSIKKINYRRRALKELFLHSKIF